MPKHQQFHVFFQITAPPFMIFSFHVLCCQRLLLATILLFSETFVQYNILPYSIANRIEVEAIIFEISCDRTAVSVYHFIVYVNKVIVRRTCLYLISNKRIGMNNFIYNSVPGKTWLD